MGTQSANFTHQCHPQPNPPPSTGFLARDCRPVHLVQGEGFRDFVHALNPRYQLPGPKTIKLYMEAMYDQARADLNEYVAPLRQPGPAALRTMAGCISLDAWSDVSQESYLAVLLHTVKVTDAGYEAKMFCLRCEPIEAAHHTAEAIQKLVETALAIYELPPKNIFRAVHDGDSKVIKGASGGGERGRVDSETAVVLTP